MALTGHSGWVTTLYAVGTDRGALIASAGYDGTVRLWDPVTGAEAGRFETGAYGADLAKYGVLGSTDRLGFRVAQPLRIETGGFSMMLPTAYDYATETATSSLVGYSLSPSGREIDGELSYSTQLGRAWLGGNLFVRRDPGHIADADDDYGAAIRFTLGF